MTTLPSTEAIASRTPSAGHALGVARSFSVAALVVLLDQGVKALVRARLDYGATWPEGWELIRLTHIENTGAAFGILQGAGGALTVVTLIAIAAIAVILLRLSEHNRRYALSLSAILGGAIGNLIDRLRLGAVTDFIDPTHYPAFNIADSAIVVGVLALLALTWFEPTPPAAEEAPAAPEVAS